MKDDGGGKLCAYIPLSPGISVMEWREEEQRRWKVTEVGWGEGERGEVCWSSCVLAVGSRGVVGIGQVRVSLPAGYAVQLCLYVAQAQLRT